MSPVRPIKLSSYLEQYDKQRKLELVDGFTRGFDIGFRGIPNNNTKIANLKSTLDHPLIVGEKIKKELDENRLLGPFDFPPFENFQINPIGLVPKKDPGTFRLITHLSSPSGKSINDQIPREFSEVHYASIHDAIKILISIGKGAFMAKTDIKNAFRLLPVKMSQQKLLGIKWNDKYFFDKCLPMGASSSCNLFEKFSSALEFISHQQGIHNLIHYLDDFLIISYSANKCGNDLDLFLKICEDINVPLASEKTFYPSQTIQFLGIELDSVKQEIRLPQDKLEKCKSVIKTLLTKDKCSLLELQSLLGLLSFACVVVVPGRAFLESVRLLTKGLRKPHYKRRLTHQTKSDLRVWLNFLEHYNGVTLYRDELFISPGVVHIYTDASQSFGLGAVLGNCWFALQWPSTWWCQQNITLLEFMPILLAVLSWRDILKNKAVIFHSDNQSLVHVINHQRSEEDLVRVILRNFILGLLTNNILARAQHIIGSVNKRADALSRNMFKQFHSLHPTAHQMPSPTPALPQCLESTTTWTCF